MATAFDTYMSPSDFENLRQQLRSNHVEYLVPGEDIGSSTVQYRPIPIPPNNNGLQQALADLHQQNMRLQQQLHDLENQRKYEEMRWKLEYGSLTLNPRYNGKYVGATDVRPEKPKRKSKPKPTPPFIKGILYGIPILAILILVSQIVAKL